MRSILALSCILALLGCGNSSDNKPQKGTPVRYEYSYSGTMANPITWYEVTRLEDGTMTISHSADSPEKTVIKAPADALEHIGALVNDNKLYKLAGSYQPNMDILDGYGWTLFVEYEDGYIASGGSNAWPSSKLWSGVSAINSYIQGIIDSATEADIISKK
ncbi:MAG: hypothetical protein J6O51_00140 [Bacteroidales bacterium]|nr:hypothetical protein [Bacteroidales bacterium]